MGGVGGHPTPYNETTLWVLACVRACWYVLVSEDTLYASDVRLFVGDRSIIPTLDINTFLQCNEICML
jgi:hypothetical protein